VFGGVVDRRGRLGAAGVLSRGVEGVDVAGGGVAMPHDRIVPFAVPTAGAGSHCSWSRYGGG
jgi:hypothetical protein